MGWQKRLTWAWISNLEPGGGGGGVPRASLDKNPGSK